MKVKFLKNYSPRKKGETTELESKLAEWYVANNIAEIHDCKCNDKTEEKCSDCEEQAKSKTVKITTKKK